MGILQELFEKRKSTVDYALSNLIEDVQSCKRANIDMAEFICRNAGDDDFGDGDRYANVDVLDKCTEILGECEDRLKRIYQSFLQGQRKKFEKKPRKKQFNN